MCVSAIIAAVGALGSLAAGVKGLTSSGKQQVPQISAPPLPPGPAADLDAAGLAGARSASATPPNFLRFGSGMTPLQQRSTIATFGTQGTDGRYTDPATKDYFKNLVTNSLLDPSGKTTGNLLDVEKQYASNVLGVKPRADTTESWISAMLRG